MNVHSDPTGVEDMSLGEPSADRPSADEIKKAFKAFKKRLKLTRLDDESRIAGGPMSKGQPSGIVAITPPNQFSSHVWEELVRRGKIKPAGHGTYQLVED
jgi:hypothetical protein